MKECWKRYDLPPRPFPLPFTLLQGNIRASPRMLFPNKKINFSPKINKEKTVLFCIVTWSVLPMPVSLNFSTLLQIKYRVYQMVGSY